MIDHVFIRRPAPELWYREAQVVALLCRGMRLKDAASEMGVRYYNAARNTLAIAGEKPGTSRQAGVIGIVLGRVPCRMSADEPGSPGRGDADRLAAPGAERPDLGFSRNGSCGRDACR